MHHSISAFVLDSEELESWRVLNGATISTDSLVVSGALQMQNEIQVVRHGKKRTKLPFNSCFLRSELTPKRSLYVLGFTVCRRICLRHFAQEHHRVMQSSFKKLSTQIKSTLPCGKYAVKAEKAESKQTKVDSKQAERCKQA